MKSIKNYLVLLLVALSAGISFGKDFTLHVLKHASNPTFYLSNFSGQTYFDAVTNAIAPEMLAQGAGGASNEEKLFDGQGVSVKLSENNFNVHINYPAAPIGGRSYGWTSGKVGDWSDEMYLRNIGNLMDSGDVNEIRAFYHVMIKLLGQSDSTELEGLSFDGQRVATNYLAIYTAEAYRRIQDPNTRWDDALSQVTFLAAFHGGQSEFKMFYTGKFTNKTKEKGPGVYANGREGVLFEEAEEKDAEMIDYHQFSRKTPDQEGSNRSGINLTRNDFERMGRRITSAEYKNPNLAKIRSVVGYSKNVFSSIAAYYAEGRASAEDTAVLADAVADFMVDVYNDADKITTKLSSTQQ